jgi:glutathione S-transferase
MQLYFAPLACSLATRIAFYEADAKAEYIQVDTKRKVLTKDNADFNAVNPLGQVPVLRLDDGSTLTENTAVLQYVAECFPQTRLMPAGGPAQARVRQWLGFIGTELHKAVYVPLLDSKASDAVKAYSRDKIKLRLDFLQSQLAGRQYLADHFTIADAYLTTILNWSRATSIDLSPWPAVADYYARMLKRPSIAKAVSEEYELYMKEK